MKTLSTLILAAALGLSLTACGSMKTTTAGADIWSQEECEKLGGVWKVWGYPEGAKPTYAWCEDA